MTLSISAAIICAWIIFNLGAFFGFALSAIFHAGKDRPEDFA